MRGEATSLGGANKRKVLFGRDPSSREALWPAAYGCRTNRSSCCR